MAKVTDIRRRGGLWRVFLRLLFMQAVLNQRGMQNLGFGGAISEVSKRLGGRDSSLLSRHLSFFNCNPNLAPLIVGGVIRLEEERLEGKPIEDNDIEHFKASLSSPLAAMGDMLILGNLKPLTLTLACIFAIYGIPIGLLAVLLLYNLTIISCRLWGVYFGYAKGWELVDWFSGPDFQRVLGVVQGLGAGVGGVLIGIVFNRLPQNGQWTLLPGVVLVLVTLYLLKRNVPASWFAILLFPASILLTLLLS